jgi:hypothetical protein
MSDKEIVGNSVCDLCGEVSNFYREKKGGAIYERCSDQVDCKNFKNARGKKAQEILQARMEKVGETVVDSGFFIPSSGDKQVVPGAEKKPEADGVGWRGGVWVLLSLILAVLGVKGVKLWKQ